MGRAVSHRHQKPAPRRGWLLLTTVGLIGLLSLAAALGWLEHLPRHDQLVRWMRRDGIVGPLVCIGIQFLQVVIFAIPGEVTQVAAGYVFGAGWGFAYSIIGILCGATFAFGLAKAVGRPTVQRMIGASKLARMDTALQSRKGHLAIFMLFLLPGMPKDALSYAAGLAQLGLGRFLLLSVPARAPALLASTLFGSQAGDRNLIGMLWLAIGVVLILVAAACCRRRLKTT